LRVGTGDALALNRRAGGRHFRIRDGAPASLTTVPTTDPVVWAWAKSVVGASATSYQYKRSIFSCTFSFGLTITRIDDHDNS
jgi:hypothetical protein